MAYPLGYAGGYGDVSTIPIVTVEVAFTTNPGATPTWTDISDYLIDFSVHRGRDQELSRFSAGHANLILANDDRRFDPTYAAGPYYPNVLPMRRVRIRATYNSITYDIFNGYVDGWEQTYSHPGVGICVLTATDAFKVLASIELPTSGYAAEILADSPAHWWRLGEPAGSATAVDAAGPNDLTVTGPVTFGTASLVSRDPDTAATFTLASTGRMTSTTLTAIGTGPFSVELLVRSSLAGAGTGNAVMVRTTTAATADIQVYIDNAGWLHFDCGGAGTISTNSIIDGLTHHVVGTRAVGGNLKLYVDGVDNTVGTPNDTTNIAGTTVYLGASFNPSDSMSGVLDEVAVYPTALSAARISAHYAALSTPWNGDLSGARINRILDAAGWPAADRNIDPGVAVLQSATLGGGALTALQKVEETEQGLLFVTAAGLVRFIGRDSLIKAPYTTVQATFGDSGTELEYADLRYRYDDQTVVNEARVSRLEGTAVVISDSASQATYLRRTRTVDGLLHSSDATSRDLANWIIAHYKDALMRATGMRLEPAAGTNAATHYPQVLGRELGDRVNVKRRPQNLGAAIDQDAQIEGIAHQVVGATQTWSADWNLSPAESQVYGVWDAATALWDTARWGF